MKKVYNAPACEELGNVMKLTRGRLAWKFQNLFVSIWESGNGENWRARLTLYSGNRTGSC